MIQLIKDLYYYLFSEKLNNGYWLTTQLYHEKKSHLDISIEIGCSVQCIDKKVAKRQKQGYIGRDVLGGVHTCRFHSLTKSSIVLVFKLFKNKIVSPIDELYPQLKSRNAKIFAKILLEMEQKDQDTGNSTGFKAGFSRKDFYLLAGKFAIVLYEFDSYYSERIDYFLKRVLDHCGTFFLDDMCDPANWHPNRTALKVSLYYAMRQYDGDAILFAPTIDEIKIRKDEYNRSLLKK